MIKRAARGRRLASAAAALVAGLGGWAPVRAEVTQASANGFTITVREELRVSPQEAWAAIVQLPRWWSDQHTWSGKAANMSLDAQAGGCWCERWGNGESVQHGQVLLVQPGRVLRLAAPLGPVQELPVAAVLTLVTSAQDGKTFLRLTYRVGGPPDVGLEALAPAVDRVMAQQFRRLKSFAETGRPE
jgi:uncharacterized protein YndB with AHSA1/START domain